MKGAPRSKMLVRLIAGFACATLYAPFAGVAAPAAVKRVGGMTLEHCVEGLAYCGRIDRPLDPSGTIGGRISIYFEFYPHTAAGPSAGTLVATEGGPGYPATESREDYLALFRPLRARRDVVLMDNRGTGKSGAIDCPALQTAEQWTVELVGACGASLGERAALYSTAYAADDLAAIIAALEVGRIDLYGDSYGTYFEQVFALRHPRALRSVVLDGAYPLQGPDYPWYPTYAPAMRAKFDLACRRSASCARLPGSSLEHVMPTLEELRRAPFAAQRLRRRRPRALLSGRCVTARHRHVRQRPGPGDRQGGRRRGTRLSSRRSAAAPAAHGRNPERRRFPRSLRRSEQMERGPRCRGDVSGSAADL